MRCLRIILLMMLAIVCLGISADKKKKKWPTDPDYLARREATAQAMDSVLKYADTDPEPLMIFADEKSKEFDHDPYLMSRFAEGFALRAGQMSLSAERFREIKRLYPDYLDGYYNYALTMDAKAIEVKPEGNLSRDEELAKLAKMQIDSAKMVAPASQQPYVMWLRRCTRYIFNDAVKKEFEDEVEAFRKAFPNENVYYMAAQILSDKDNPMAMANFNSDKLRSDAEFERSQLALTYFNKIDINALSADQLNNLTYFYYESTKSLYLDSKEKATFYEKGLEGARLGLTKYPDSVNFNRLALYHAAELAKLASDNEDRMAYASAARTVSEKLISSSAKMLREDYFYAGLALQYTEQYAEAISMYQTALERKLPYNERFHHCDSLTAYQNISDCYKEGGNRPQAILQLQRLYQVRQQHGGQLRRSDLMALVKIYNAMGGDTLNTDQERFDAYAKADSLYAVLQDSIDLGTPVFDNMSKAPNGYYMYQRFSTRLRMDQIDAFKDREVLTTFETAQTFVQRIESVGAQSEAENEMLMRPYDYLMRRYLSEKDYRQTLKYVERIEKISPGTYPKDWIDNLRKVARRQR